MRERQFSEYGRREGESVAGFVERLINDAADEIEELEAKLEAEIARNAEAADRPEKTCKWVQQALGTGWECDSWGTECGEDFAITEEWHETPTPFCSNCGGRTIDATPKQEQQDE